MLKIFKKIWFQYLLMSIGFINFFLIQDIDSSFKLTDIIYQSDSLTLTYFDIMFQGSTFAMTLICFAAAVYYFYVGEETTTAQEEYEVPEGEEDFLNLTKEEKEELNKREEAALKQLADYEASILIK